MDRYTKPLLGFNSRSLTVLIVAALLVAWGAPAFAETTTYTDRTAWEAAVIGTVQTEDFNSITPFLLPANGTTTVGLVDIETVDSTGYTAVRAYNYEFGGAVGDLDGTNYLAIFGDGSPIMTVTIQFPDAVSAWGMDWEEYIPADDTQVTFGADISSEKLATLTGGSHSGFVGFVSDTAFTQVKFSDEYSSYSYANIDNLSFSVAHTTPYVETWSDVRTNVDGTGLDNSGTLLQAVNFVDSLVSGTGNGGNDIDTTVNGITFTGTVSTSASGTYYTTTNLTATDIDRTSDAVSGDAIYSLVYSAAITDSNEDHTFVNLRNLTIGNDYRVQFIFSSSDEERLIYAVSENLGDIGYYGTVAGISLFTGIFTAESSTAVYEFYTQHGRGLRPQLSGFALHDITIAAAPAVAVPTPAALPAGLALLGLMTARRRRR